MKRTITLLLLIAIHSMCSAMEEDILSKNNFKEAKKQYFEWLEDFASKEELTKSWKNLMQKVSDKELIYISSKENNEDFRFLICQKPVNIKNKECLFIYQMPLAMEYCGTGQIEEMVATKFQNVDSLISLVNEKLYTPCIYVRGWNQRNNNELPKKIKPNEKLYPTKDFATIAISYRIKKTQNIIFADPLCPFPLNQTTIENLIEQLKKEFLNK